MRIAHIKCQFFSLFLRMFSPNPPLISQKGSIPICYVMIPLSAGRRKNIFNLSIDIDILKTFRNQL
jgi:hypothetical protein